MSGASFEPCLQEKKVAVLFSFFRTLKGKILDLRELCAVDPTEYLQNIEPAPVAGKIFKNSDLRSQPGKCRCGAVVSMDGNGHLPRTIPV